MGTGTQVHDGAASSLPMPAPSLVPVTDDGAHLTVVPHLARLIDTPHAGADGSVGGPVTAAPAPAPQGSGA